jgi:hypothetical protein
MKNIIISLFQSGIIFLGVAIWKWISSKALLVRIPRIVFYMLIILLLISFQASAFANPENDLDRDGLSDRWESELAEKYQPYFIFDSAESATRPFEPVVLYQVYCSNPKSRNFQSCREVKINYGLLWRRDGGYGTDASIFCQKDDHDGDNQRVSVVVGLGDERVKNVFNSRYIWPDNTSRIEWKSRSPVIYLSASKHHQFFNTKNDHEDSPYSDPPLFFSRCNEDVNGMGVHKFGTITNDVEAYNRVNNVGEHFKHLIGDLTKLGFPGENAWGTESFCGGTGNDCDDTDPMKSIWDKWYIPPGDECDSGEKKVEGCGREMSGATYYYCKNGYWQKDYSTCRC